MNEKFLTLTPRRILCPYCGEWHQADLFHELSYYNSSLCTIRFECAYKRSLVTKIYFTSEFCFYETDPVCISGNLNINDKIHISEIVENLNEFKVTFSVPLTTTDKVGYKECSMCTSQYTYPCQMRRLGSSGDHRHMTIQFGFEFEKNDFKRIKRTNNSKVR